MKQNVTASHFILTATETYSVTNIRKKMETLSHNNEKIMRKYKGDYQSSVY